MTLSPETATRIRAFRPMSLINPVFNQQSKISYSLEKTKHAVRQGVLQSHRDAVIFLDGNLHISPDSIKDYYVERLRTSDLVIASKRHPKSSIIIPTPRAFLSRAEQSINLLIRMATGMLQKDTQARLKVGNGEIMCTIFRNASVNRYAFDVELFIIASIRYLKVQEMPVVIKIDRQFKTNEIVNMFVDIKYEFVTNAKSFMLTRNNWPYYIYGLNWKITGVSISKIVLVQRSIIISLLCKITIRKLSQVER